MELSSVLEALEQMGSTQIRNIYLRHGAPENIFGVKVGDMKTLVKQTGKNHALALQLYASGNADAMYLAGLIAEPGKFTRNELQQWAETAPWYMISEYTVPWMASESDYGLEMARIWIDDPTERIAAAGWTTWSCLLALKPDKELDHGEVMTLLNRVVVEIAGSPERVKYAMNGFVISVGCYMTDLHILAIETAGRIGKVRVEMNGTQCTVPDAVSYILKVAQAWKTGKKKKL